MAVVISGLDYEWSLFRLVRRAWRESKPREKKKWPPEILLTPGVRSAIFCLASRKMDKAKDGLVFVGFGAYRLASKLLKDHPDTMAKYIRKQRCMYAIIQEYSKECFQPKISRKIRTSILARKNNILIENKGNKGENKTENNVLF